MTTVRQWYPKAVRPFIQRGIVPRLAALRRELETEAGELAELELPTLLLLADVCKALGLGPRDRRAVLGQKAAEQAEAWGEVSVSLNQTQVPRGKSGHNAQQGD